jgi:hypothetical protein
MWLGLSVLALVCAVLVTAAVLDHKARRRGRRAHLAGAYEHGYHAPSAPVADFPLDSYNCGGASF